MSESTIVSIVPFPIIETKPGIYPGNFRINAANSTSQPELLVIGDSKYHVELDENRTITVPCDSAKVAHSIVEDYIISNLAFDREKEAAPGIFWKPGRHDLTSVTINFSSDLLQARENQQRWFTELVKIADDDWEKTRQHRAISDMQRYAAKSLGMDRPWIIVSKDVNKDIAKKCIACQSIVSIEAIVCPTCKCIIDPEKYKTLQFA